MDALLLHPRELGDHKKKAKVASALDTLRFAFCLLFLIIPMTTTAFSDSVLGQLVQPFPPSQPQMDNDNDNSLNQDCSQTAIGKEITQSQECKQQRDTIENDNDSLCPTGYYRNSLGLCVPLLQLSP